MQNVSKPASTEAGIGCQRLRRDWQTINERFGADDIRDVGSGRPASEDEAGPVDNDVVLIAKDGRFVWARPTPASVGIYCGQSQPSIVILESLERKPDQSSLSDVCRLLVDEHSDPVSANRLAPELLWRELAGFELSSAGIRFHERRISVGTWREQVQSRQLDVESLKQPLEAVFSESLAEDGDR